MPKLVSEAVEGILGDFKESISSGVDLSQATMEITIRITDSPASVVYSEETKLIDFPWEDQA